MRGKIDFLDENRYNGIEVNVMFNGIDEHKINLKTFRITKLKRDILTIYDKYELSFFLKTGEEKKITLYVDKGTVPEGIPYEFRGREEEYKKNIMNFF